MSEPKHNSTALYSWPSSCRSCSNAFLQFAIAEALQPHQCYGRKERQALQQQDRCEQVGLDMTVDIDGIDRGGAGSQQRAEQHLRHRHNARTHDPPTALSRAIEEAVARRKCRFK